LLVTGRVYIREISRFMQEEIREHNRLYGFEVIQTFVSAFYVDKLLYVVVYAQMYFKK